MAQLRIKDRNGSEQIKSITAARISIGRNYDNDVVLRHSKVSRQHAALVHENGAYIIEDLRSSNGTYINDEKLVTRHRLRTGDVIRIADFELLLDVPIEDTSAVSVESKATAPSAPRPKREVELPPEPERERTPLPARKTSSDQKREQILFEIRQEIHKRLLEYMDLRKMDFGKIQDLQLHEDTGRLVDEIILELSDDIPGWVDRPRLSKDVLDEALGLGAIEDYLRDESITEVMVNNADQIFIERAGRLQRVNRRFSSNEAVLAVIERIVGPIGRRIDESNPYVDARLKDGSRVNAIIPPLALTGPTVTIRKFAKNPYTIENLISFGTLSAEMAMFLKACVMGRRNIIISGGTGSGKTTLLNVVSAFIPEGERIITIEDSAELQLPQAHVVSLESRPPNIEGKGAITIRDLVRNSLRMRPDRIVVGECRGAEALDMLQAMNTGHEGSISTVHANTPNDSLHRLETMVLMAGMEMPMQAIRDQITSAINIIVQTHRFSDGTRKITNISEVRGFDKANRIKVVHIMRYRQETLDAEGRVIGDFISTGEIPTFIDEFKARGIRIDAGVFEAERVLGKEG
ncbi:Flp pilus assembly complex ATPase component TadA [bacterium]|nr:Flp pilus assembly complex ATPase component TadA [candidate division CSSED10-310 bacterium]